MSNSLSMDLKKHPVSVSKPRIKVLSLSDELQVELKLENLELTRNKEFNNQILNILKQ